MTSRRPTQGWSPSVENDEMAVFLGRLESLEGQRGGLVARLAPMDVDQAPVELFHDARAKGNERLPAACAISDGVAK